MTIVLIHSPLVGPLTWQSCAQVLRDRGHRVVVPSLAGVISAPQRSYHRAFAERVAGTMADLHREESLVLVGHSGAGPLLPAVVDALGGGVSAAIFVDAEIPHEGESLFEAVPPEAAAHVRSLARGGWLPTWENWFPRAELEAALPDQAMRARFLSELPEIPVAYLEEGARLFPSWSSVRCGYLRISGEYDNAAAEAEQRGWPTLWMEADHLAMLTRPADVSAALERVIESVTGETQDWMNAHESRPESP